MITIIADFEIKPECVEAFRKAAQECIVCSREEEGNASYDLHVSINQDNRFFFIENWKDEEAIAFHHSTEHFQKFAGAFRSMITRDVVDNLVTKI